jgi:hypothetical protein
MNPPVDRENLRDVLIALVVAFGLAWAVAALQGCPANKMPPVSSMACQSIDTAAGGAMTLA